MRLVKAQGVVKVNIYGGKGGTKSRAFQIVVHETTAPEVFEVIQKALEEKAGAFVNPFAEPGA